MKREYPLFTLYCERNVTSAQMVEKHLKAPLFHERSGKPCVQGFQISLSDCRGITFLAVLKGKGSIGVDAEDPARQPPAPLKDIFAWTDLEAFCKALGRGVSTKDVKHTVPANIVLREVIEGLAVSVCVMSSAAEQMK